MTAKLVGIIIVFLINFIVSLIYLLYGLLVRGKKHNTDGNYDRKRYIISFIVSSVSACFSSSSSRRLCE